jgi:SAM-dependent MidA family methyltransferase
MNPLALFIREEINRSGPIPFDRFMDLALYHPAHGYYRGGRDPFGKSGDYFTAEQLQPVFGVLMAARIRALFEDLGRPSGFTIVELGAGRGEMAEALAEFSYIPIEAGRSELPDRFEGVVFANEFFDALPVRVAVRRESAFRQMRVGWSGERFVWVEGDVVDEETEHYLRRYVAVPEEGGLAEINLEALRWIERIAARLERGFLFAIDYGYTLRESVRFPRGSLMSYRRHAAHEDVLADPGGRDITAHVSFTALQEHGAACGIETVCFETLASTLLRAGEADQFASALAGRTEAECNRRKLQLKTLLFGMGETFRTLLGRRRQK